MVLNPKALIWWPEEYRYRGTTPYDHPVNTTTIITTTFLLPERIESPVISTFYNLVNPTTPLLRPHFHGLKLVVLAGFHCIYNIFFLNSTIGLLQGELTFPHEKLLDTSLVSSTTQCTLWNFYMCH